MLVNLTPVLYFWSSRFCYFDARIQPRWKKHVQDLYIPVQQHQKTAKLCNNKTDINFWNKTSSANTLTSNVVQINKQVIFLNSGSKLGCIKDIIKLPKMAKRCCLLGVSRSIKFLWAIHSTLASIYNLCLLTTNVTVITLFVKTDWSQSQQYTHPLIRSFINDVTQVGGGGRHVLLWHYEVR